MPLPAYIISQLTTSLEAQTALSQSTPRLDNALSNIRANELPPISVSSSHGRLLSILCKLTNSTSVLEIGTLGGYSTIWLAESIPGIKVTSIESNSRHRDVAEKNLKGLDNVDIRLGAALDVLPKLEAESLKFDFILVDADWPNQHRYFEWAVRLAEKGACIYVDNAIWKMTRAEREGDVEAKALLDSVKMLGDRVEATLIPTLSTYDTDTRELVDGILLAWVK